MKQFFIVGGVILLTSFFILSASLSIFILLTPLYKSLDTVSLKHIGNIDSSVELHYPSNWNYSQSLNNCGPYATAAALRFLDQAEYDSEHIANNMTWRVPHVLTHPNGIINALEAYDKTTYTPTLHSHKNKDKLQFIKSYLSADSVVIILGGYNNSYFKHYITLLGYDTIESSSVFYVYDPLVSPDPDNSQLTVDLNGDLPGNQSLTESELIGFWKHGGILNQYQWYSIVASNKI